jgi:hypothetical protein
LKKDRHPNSHRTEDNAFAMFGDRVPHKRDAYGGGGGPMEQPNNDYTPQAAGFDQQFTQKHKGPSVVVTGSNSFTSDNHAKANVIAQQGHAHGYAQAVRDLVRRDGSLDLPPPPAPPETKTWAQAKGEAAPVMTWPQAQYQAAHQYDNPPVLPPPPAPPADSRVATVPDEDTVTSDNRTKTAEAKQEKSAKTPSTTDTGDEGGKEEKEAKEYGKSPPRSKHPGPSKEEDIKAQDEPTHETNDDTYGFKSSQGSGPGPTKTAEKIPAGLENGDGFEAKIAAARREGFAHGHEHASGRMGLPAYMSDDTQHFGDVNMAGQPPPQMAQMPQQQPMGQVRPQMAMGQQPMQQPTPQMGQMQPRPQVPMQQALLQQQAQQAAMARPQPPPMQAQPAPQPGTNPQAGLHPQASGHALNGVPGGGAPPQQFHDVDMAGGPPKEAFGDEGYHQAIHYGVPEDLARKAYIERRLSAPEVPRRNVDARLASEPAPGRDRPVGDDQYRQAILHGLPQDRAMQGYLDRRLAPEHVREPISMTHFQQGQFTPAPSFGPGRQMNGRAWPEQFSDKDYAERITSPAGVLERNQDLPGGVERIGTHADVDRYAGGKQYGEPVFSPDRNGVMRSGSSAPVERWTPPPARAQWLDQLQAEAARTHGDLGRSVEANNRVLDTHAGALEGRYVPSGLTQASPSMRPDPADEAIRRVAGRHADVEDDDNPYDDGAD